MAGELIRVERADLGYPGHAVLRDVSLELRPAELVAVLGANGSGKTTFVRSLLGFLSPLRGEIHRAPSLRIGYVPQRETLDDRYPLTARDVALMGTFRDVPFWRRTGASERERARAALEASGASDFARTRYSQLSGGQRQRVLIARALATEPQLLLLDEPTAGVDEVTERTILAALARLVADRGLSVWLVTHHAEAVRPVAGRVVRLADGRVFEEGAA